MEKFKKCLDCNGVGEVRTMERVYSDDIVEAPVGTETCENCNGTGEEQDDEIVLERMFDNNEVIKKLQEYFVKETEGRATKDNCEDMFEGWVSGLSLKKVEEIYEK
jgi:formate-dependent nitrite reductase cytochrome c552 subunit